MSRKRAKDVEVEDGQVDQPVIAASEDGVLAELAAENQVAIQEDAEQQQEEIASGDTENVSSDEVAAFNQAARARGEEDQQVEAPADPERGTGFAASPEDTEEVLPSQDEYAGVRDPNFQFQERGKDRLVEGSTVDAEEAVASAESSE
jgi:hypothetical protein